MASKVLRTLLHGDYEEEEDPLEHLLEQCPCGADVAAFLTGTAPDLHADETLTSELGDNTKGLRIAAVFIIFAAGIVGGFPPLWLKVRSGQPRRFQSHAAAATGRSRVLAIAPGTIRRLRAILMGLQACTLACRMGVLSAHPMPPAALPCAGVQDPRPHSPTVTAVAVSRHHPSAGFCAHRARGRD